MYVVFFPLVFISGIVLLTIYTSKQNKQKQELLLNIFKESFTFNKKFVKANVFASGRKNNSLVFNVCHIHTTENVVLLFGYKDLGVFTINIVPILLTNHPEKYIHLAGTATIIKPKKFNPHSFNDDVYIEFGESGWQTTSVDIRLLKLTNEEKQHMLFLE